MYVIFVRFFVQFTVTLNYSLKEKIQVVQEYYRNGETQSEAQRQLNRKHGFEPDRCTIANIIKTFEISGCVEKPRPHEYERSVRTPEAFGDFV